MIQTNKVIINIKNVIFLCYLIVILKLVLAQDSFSYNSQYLWKKDYPACGLSNQSPIELIRIKNEFKRVYSKLKYYNFNMHLELPITIHNNGHTAAVMPGKKKKGNRPIVTGKFLSGQLYQFEAFHFHWGSKNNRGSEHTLNYRHYSLELHVVHKNIKYKTIKEALRHNDGVLVLGLLYKASKSMKDYNFGLDIVTRNLFKIQKYDSKYNITNRHFSMNNLLGDLDRNKFFTYQGSLTTPPCHKPVTWVVYQDVQMISEYQLKQFRKLKDKDGEQVSDNYRKLQPLGDRNVYYYNNVLL